MTGKSIRQLVNASYEPFKTSNEVHLINWKKQLDDAGYNRVQVSTTYSLPSYEMVSWLNEHVGHDHYYVAGNDIWFDDDEKLTLYILRWI